MLDADGDDGVVTKLRHEHGQVAVRGGWLSATGDMGVVGGGGVSTGISPHYSPTAAKGKLP